MIRFIKSLFCKHDLRFDHNIYGDAIIYSGFRRSVWYCRKCDKRILKEVLHEESA